MKHTCHARNCEVTTPRKMFMCRRHWYMLPKEMRDAVWATYTTGQERDISKVTREYLVATRTAINYIHEKENA